jgi:cyclopropane fatty-acyl-phospholipid synthase-like methyltransferase
VVASDLSSAAVARAKREADQRGFAILFHVSDMTSLAEIEDRDFDVVAALDNALPHLTREQVAAAVCAMGSKMNQGGLLLASIRDYDTLIDQKPTSQAPAFYGGEGARRIVHQVWDWIDGERYSVHLYITMQQDGEWKAHHFVSEYRCLLRDELTKALERGGFGEIHWLMPNESGFYQPIVLARKGESARVSR